MKIIEAMKRIKENKEKITDLQKKISANTAFLSYETPPYGADKTAAQVQAWTQAAHDIVLDNVALLVRISKTNIATNVTITLGEQRITKTMAEWIWRRREYAAIDFATWSTHNDRGLKEGRVQTVSGGDVTEIKIVRYYDPAQRDAQMAIYRSEPHAIDGALEVVNATTELLD